MTHPAPGLLVFDRAHDVHVFASWQDAVGRGIEAIDVEDGEYPEIFTHDGYVVTATTEGNDVHLLRTSQRDEARLMDLLRSRRPAAKLAEPGDVLRLVNDELRWQWEHRWPRRPKWLSARLHGRQPRQVS